MYSKLSDPTEEEIKSNDFEDDQEKIWSCEFCNNKNTVNPFYFEIPKKDSVNYILKNAKVEEKIDEDQAVVFCIDTSSSMRAK